MLSLHKRLPQNTAKSTYAKIQMLYDKFTYENSFKREDIENILNIKKSRASEIISILQNCELIEPSDPTKYRFKK